MTTAHELLDLVPEEEGDSTNVYTINALNVQTHLDPEVTDPLQLLNDTPDFIQGVVRRRDGHRSQKEEQN